MTMKPHDELSFAYKVRRMLDDGIQGLPRHATNRLAQARQKAIARKKPEELNYVTVPVMRLAGAFSNQFHDARNWFVRIGIALPLLLLALGSIGLYYYEQERSIDELAELDTAVLTDELPIDAYLDHGFNTYLNKHGDSDGR